MTIRAFCPDDLDLLRAMTVEAFDGVSIDQAIEREFGIIQGRDWQFRKARHIDDDTERDPDGIYVLEIDGEVAGFISTRQDRDAGVGFIPNLVLAPQHRGQGWGRKLIVHALERFREAGLTHARIETLVQNDVGNHLYQSIGFREVARQVHFCASVEEALGRSDKSH